MIISTVGRLQSTNFNIINFSAIRNSIPGNRVWCVTTATTTSTDLFFVGIPNMVTTFAAEKLGSSLEQTPWTWRAFGREEWYDQLKLFDLNKSALVDAEEGDYTSLYQSSVLRTDGRGVAVVGVQIQLIPAGTAAAKQDGYIFITMKQKKSLNL